MNILIKFELMLILTTVTGSICYGIWYIFARLSDRYQMTAWGYHMLKMVIALFCVPVAYMAVRLSQWDHGAWIGDFTESTMIIQRISRALFGVWCVGAVFTAYVLMKNLLKEHRTNSRYHQQYGRQSQIAAQICKEMEISRTIPVYMGEGYRSPAIGGCFFPKIYMGEAVSDDAELRLIFRHELMHYRHRDVWMLTLLMFMRIVHWFNPLFARGWIYRQYCSWSEDYCDLCVCKTENKNAYIRTLLMVAVNSAERSYGSGICMGENMSDVRRRIVNMENREKRKAMKRGGIFLCLLLSLMTGCTTVYAASEGIVAGYEKLYASTLVEIEDTYVEPVLEEYVEYPGEGDPSVIEEIGEISESRSGDNNNINWKIGAKVRKISSGFSMEKGKKIYIAVSVVPADKKVKVGVKDPDGILHYVSSKENITYTYTTTKKGTHRVFVENNNTVSVEAKGYYTK